MSTQERFFVKAQTFNFGQDAEFSVFDRKLNKSVKVFKGNTQEKTIATAMRDANTFSYDLNNAEGMED